MTCSQSNIRELSDIALRAQVRIWTQYSSDQSCLLYSVSRLLNSVRRGTRNEVVDLQDTAQEVNFGTLNWIGLEEVVGKESDFAVLKQVRCLLVPDLLLALPHDFSTIFNDTIKMGVDAEKLHGKSANATTNIYNSCAMR